MRAALVIATLAGGFLATVTACSSDTRLPPAPALTFSAQTDDEGALVVDDDRADCPRADFNSIEAAVLAATSGQTILVCAGTYHETVTIPSPKSDLTLVAKGKPGAVILDGENALQIGLLLQNVTSVLVEGFTVRQYQEAGIVISGGSQNTIRKTVTTATREGISLRQATSANVVEHNLSFANPVPASCGALLAFLGSCGILVTDLSTNNVLRHNEVFDSGFGVLLFRAGTGNVVFHNELHDNVFQGVANTVTPGTLIAGNRSFRNRAGVSVTNSRGVTVRNNRLGSNTNNGIILNVGSQENLVEENHTEGNGTHGITLQANASANTVRVNKSDRNGLDGIRVDATSIGNTIAQNLMRDNTEHDAHDDFVGPNPPAFTANLWLKNHCETENRPGLCARPARERP